MIFDLRNVAFVSNDFLTKVALADSEFNHEINLSASFVENELTVAIN